MSRVSVTRLAKGTARDAADLNATNDSWDSATASIDGTNIRDGGLANRNFSFGTVTPLAKRGFIAKAGTSSSSAGTSYGPITYSGADLELTSLNFNNNTKSDVLLLRASVRFGTDTNSPSRYAYFKLQYDEGVSGAWSSPTDISETERQFRLWTNLSGLTRYKRFNGVYQVTYLFNPSPALTTTDLDFRVVFKADSGLTLDAFDSVLMATTFQV